MVPNLLPVMATSAPVLRAFDASKIASEDFLLSHREREMVALAVSEFNYCPYCLAFHTANAEVGSREIIKLLAVIGAIEQANLTANVAQLELDHLEAPSAPQPGVSG